MERVSPGPRSKMAMLLLSSDTGTPSTLSFRCLLTSPAGCSLDPLGFSTAKLRLGDNVYVRGT